MLKAVEIFQLRQIPRVRVASRDGAVGRLRLSPRRFITSPVDRRVGGAAWNRGWNSTMHVLMLLREMGLEKARGQEIGSIEVFDGRPWSTSSRRRRAPTNDRHPSAQRRRIDLDLGEERGRYGRLSSIAPSGATNLQMLQTFLPRRAASFVCIGALLILAGQISLVLGDTTGATGGNAQVENHQPTLGIEYMICINGIFSGNDPNATPNGTAPPDRTTPFIGEIKPIAFGTPVPGGWALCRGQILQINQNTAIYSLFGQTYGGNGSTTFALPDLRGLVPIGAGQGAGLPDDYDLGQQVGDLIPLLSVANLPSHTHTMPGSGVTGATGNGAAFDNRQPALALHFLIAADGEIMIWPSEYGITGWGRCDGRLLSAAAYPYLYSHIGSSYGGNSTNFALPDLRGRLVLGDDQGVWPRGLNYGTNDVVLSVADLPAHTHTIVAGTTGATGSGGGNATNYQPSLVLRWMLSPFGSIPNPNAGPSFPMVGEIRIIAGATSGGLPPNQWLLLNGALFNTSTYPDLYNLIGTTFGSSGQSMFAVPDLRATAGAGTDFQTIFLGSRAGTPNQLISVAQLPSHTHSYLNLRITGIQYLSDGSAQLTLASTIGNTAQVDKSDTLPAAWSSLGSVNFNTATKTITDPNPTHELRRFYKAHIP